MSRPNNDYVTCGRCGKTLSSRNFYNNDSEIYKHNNGVINVCKDCIGELFDYYYKMFDNDNVEDKTKVKRKAVERLCMMFNYYYSDKIFDTALHAKNAASNLMSAYIRQTRLVQYKDKSYDTSLQDKALYGQNAGITTVSDQDIETVEIPEEVIQRFGKGFSNADYLWLQEEYKDWTTRHECQTKSQEENFKAICFNRLNAYKANLKGLDTKDLDKTFKELLDVGKLQPKQNAADAMSQAQTFGTLIEKYETTRPLPDIDPELKDVDKIGVYLDVFFKGHLAKMMGLNNGISRLYEKYIKKYTVEKPELDEEEDSEVLFDAIFGNKDSSDTSD